jgi:hypothetical protein
MAIDVEVEGFTGAYATFNASRTSVPVGMAELVNRSITVGGVVRGSPLERSRRRASIANVVLSSIRAAGPPISATPLATTGLYQYTETTEKTGISFRLGMGFAAVVGSRVLRAPVLKHVRSGGSGRRADLIGIDASRERHVLEAKSRTYGVRTEVVDDAKDQATTTARRFRASGRSVATASASVVDLSGSPIYVLLSDPPLGNEIGGKRFDEKAFMREFYSPVVDLLEVKEEASSGFAIVDDYAIGSWLPGADAWIGLRREFHDLLQRDLIPPIDAEPPGVSLRPDEEADWLVAATDDGHVLVLGPQSLLSASER